MISMLGNSFLRCREFFFFPLFIVRKLPLQVSWDLLPPSTPHFYHSAVLCDMDTHPMLTRRGFPVRIPGDKAGHVGHSPTSESTPPLPSPRFSLESRGCVLPRFCLGLQPVARFRKAWSLQPSHQLSELDSTSRPLTDEGPEAQGDT